MKPPGLHHSKPASIEAIAPYGLLLFLIALFYSNIYANQPLYDDLHLILANPYYGQGWHGIKDMFLAGLDGSHSLSGQFYRPLQNLLYLTLHALTPNSLFGFHFLNLALHAANACLLFRLGQKLNFDASASFFAALLWSLHPLQTEAVTYMSATGDTLHAFFCLSSLIVMLPTFTPRKILASLPFFFLALMSKEGATVLPLLACCCFFLTQPTRLDPRAYLRTWPLWAIDALYLAARLTILAPHNMDIRTIGPVSHSYSEHVAERLYTYLGTVPTSLRLLAWPSGLHMDYNIPVLTDPLHWPVCLGLLFIAAATALIVWGQGRRALPLSWGLLWFASAQIPQTGILTAVNALFCEHWLYLPSAGLFLGLAQTLESALRAPKTRILAAVVATLAVLIFGTLTYRQNAIWQDPIAFYTNIIDNGGTTVRARTNLALVYMNKGDDANAMKQFSLGIQESDIISEPHVGIAMILSKNPDGQSHAAQEIAELTRAIEINPAYIAAYEFLSLIYADTGDQTHADFYRDKVDQLRAASPQ